MYSEHELNSDIERSNSPDSDSERGDLLSDNYLCRSTTIKIAG